jgi:hypothetical protein
VAKAGTFAHIDDAGTWQREVRAHASKNIC